MVIIKRVLYYIFCLPCAYSGRKQRLDVNDRVFEEGERLVMNELNVFQIVQSLQKLKVAVHVLLEERDQPERMRKIAMCFFQNQKIKLSKIHDEDD